MKRALVLAMSIGCGARTTLDAEPRDAAIDVTTIHDAAIDVREASVSCADGTEYVEVIDETGVTMITGGCGDAGVPSAMIGGCSDKVVCLFVEACGDASIELRSLGGASPGKHGVVGYYPYLDASTAAYVGTVDVADWPDAGGIVSGDYHVTSQADASISGTFCVKKLGN